MARLSEIRLGDLTEGAARYRPVAVVVAAIVAMAQFLPGGPSSGESLESAATNNPVVDGGPAPETEEGEAIEDEVPREVPDDVPLAPAVPFDDVPSDSFTPSDTFTPDAGSSSPPPTVAPGPLDLGTGSSDERPLRITAAAWATRTAGTPVAAMGVPPQSLPVGTRFGQDDKRSFIRLAGTESVLVLKEHAEGQRAAIGASVQACLITEAGWREADALTFDQAPSWDAEKCVVGERHDDGRWSFDLSAFPDRGGDRGFALIPGPDAPVDFQVAFEEQAVG